MKALLLIESDRIANIARFYLRPLGFETIRYRNPVKALDNLEEIDPEAVIMSARDFPRHWKAIAQTIRAEKGKDGCVIVLLKGDSFPLDSYFEMLDSSGSSVTTEPYYYEYRKNAQKICYLASTGDAVSCTTEFGRTITLSDSSVGIEIY